MSFNSPHMYSDWRVSKSPTRHRMFSSHRSLSGTLYPSLLSVSNMASYTTWDSKIKTHRYILMSILLWPLIPTTKMSWLVASKAHKIPTMSVPAARNQNLIAAALCLCLLRLSLQIPLLYVQCSQTSHKNSNIFALATCLCPLWS